MAINTPFATPPTASPRRSSVDRGRLARLGLTESEIALVEQGQAPLRVPPLTLLTNPTTPVELRARILEQYHEDRANLARMTGRDQAGRTDSALGDFLTSAGQGVTAGYNPFGLPKPSGQHPIAELGGTVAGALVPGLGVTGLALRLMKGTGIALKAAALTKAAKSPAELAAAAKARRVVTATAAVLTGTLEGGAWNPDQSVSENRLINAGVGGTEVTQNYPGSFAITVQGSLLESHPVLFLVPPG